jgi:Ca-activated chloride channel family protein
MERRPGARPDADRGPIRPLGGGLLGALLLVGAALATAPGAMAAPARQPLGASRLGGDGYRFAGAPTTGGTASGQAPLLAPGTYTDTIGPGQTRWYAVRLDAASTADLSATAVPRPGAAVGFGDGLELRLTTTGAYAYTCDTQSARFGQGEGAMNLTGAVSRIPSENGQSDCDRAGRYLLAVHRTTAAGSDRRRWPVELTYGNEAPLPAGTVPAGARTDYGPAPAPVTGTAKDITGGTGFNDAAAVGTGVWRDRLLPAQTRYYKVRLGWGQQLSYAAEFANEPGSTPGSVAAVSAVVGTWLYAPGRLPVQDASGGVGNRLYIGSPVSVGFGTVPVTWTNRWVGYGPAREVRRAGDYWIAIGLGPGAAQLAPNTAVGVVLRVRVSGQELAGPQYRAPASAGRGAGAGASGGSSPPGSDRSLGSGSGGSGGGAPNASASSATSVGASGSSGASGISGISARDWLAAGTGGAVALAGLAVAALVHWVRTRTDRGGA